MLAAFKAAITASRVVAVPAHCTLRVLSGLAPPPPGADEVYAVPDVMEDGTPSGVLVAVLNRPATLNSLTPSLGKRLEALVESICAGERPGVRAVVLTGLGRAFSAGGDFGWLIERTRDSLDGNREAMLSFYNSFLSIRRLPVPVVAAVNGPAVGAGACLALACDVRVASAPALIGFNFLRLGMCPGFGVTQLLPAVVGQQAAAQLLYCGDTVSADVAMRLGLFSQVVPTLMPPPPQQQQASQQRAFQQPGEPGQQGVGAGDGGAALHAALAVARRMAGASPTCMAPTVRVLRQAVEEQGGMGLQQVLREEAEQQAASFLRPDFLEGLQAQREKREPQFPPA